MNDAIKVIEAYEERVDGPILSGPAVIGSPPVFRAIIFLSSPTSLPLAAFLRPLHNDQRKGLPGLK